MSDNQTLHVILADILPKGATSTESKARMAELVSLVETLGGVVIVHQVQKRNTPDYKTFIGKGKLQEIKQTLADSSANILILGNAVRPRQLYAINEELRDISAKCRDRVDLILKIFEKHATSMEARLQIQLAAIKHMGPRIFGMGMELSRQGGGIGTSGIGETNTEIMRRHLAEKRQQIEKKLREYSKMRKLHRAGRSRKGVQTIGLVGYTNAGKSTILSAMTNKDAYAADKLFATLGTQIGTLILGYDQATGRPQEALLCDTIGFIRDLPPKLIAAFTSTLEDSIHADILLHVVDAADPEITTKIQIVDDILDQLGATQPKYYIFNKSDQLTPEQRSELEQTFVDLQPIFISAYSKEGLEQIKNKLTPKE